MPKATLSTLNLAQRFAFKEAARIVGINPVPVSMTSPPTITNGTSTSTTTSAGSAPTITSATTAAGQVGEVFSYTITAVGTVTSYNAIGLPSGLTINTATGTISGTPVAAGETTVTLSATNSGGTDTESLTITILPAPTITLRVRYYINEGQKSRIAAISFTPDV